jgi:hypothetical protein
MKDTLLYILSQIVDHPEDIVIDEVIEGDRTIYVIHAHADDMGKIIGKRGRVIMALRDLIKIIATKQKVFADVEIAESAPLEPSEKSVKPTNE